MSGLLRELTKLFEHAERNDFLIRQVKIIMEAVSEEIEEDTSLLDLPASQKWLVDFAHLMEWCVTGNQGILSEDTLQFAKAIEARGAEHNAH